MTRRTLAARQGMGVTYIGSDDQRHYATIVHLWPDGSASIRRGYYDPLDGTRVTFRPGDRVRDYATGRPVTFGPVLSPFVAVEAR